MSPAECLAPCLANWERSVVRRDEKRQTGGDEHPQREERGWGWALMPAEDETGPSTWNL